MLGKNAFLFFSSAIMDCLFSSPVAATLITARTPIATLAERAPSFTGVSITPVSIQPPPPPTISLNLPTPTCTQTITPDKNGYVPPGTCGALYDYYPSFSAAIAASVLFGIVMLAHIIQGFVHKKGFTWVIIMGSIWEFGSYVTRSLGAKHQQSSAEATVSQILVLLAPLWVNAFDYMILARIIHFFAPSKKVWKIKPSEMAAIFVSLDIVSFLVQLIGGGMASPGASESTQMRGIHIYMGGIGLQELFIVIFTGLAIKFHIDMLKAEKFAVKAVKPKWRMVLYALYADLIAITIRIIYRLVEFSAGDNQSNPLPYHEVYFYVFDGIPMLIAILIWNLVHPGRVLQGPDSELPPSWLSRKCCCCCRGSRKKKTDPPKNSSYDGDEEMYILDRRGPSPTGARYQSPGQGYQYDARTRPADPSPPRKTGWWSRIR